MNIRTPIIITLFVTVIAIIGINGLNNYKLKTLNIAYENNVAKLQDAITAMDAVWTDYFHSPLYSDKELTNYNVKPGKFMQEFLKIKQFCGSSNGDCFAKKYTYENGQPYTPKFEGACAQLSTGPSICMIPQIKDKNIQGLIDVNGKDKPNMYGKDLRTFELDAKTRNYDPEDDQIEAVKVVKPRY